MLKIAIDAGHGGKNSTPGKRSPDGEYEWNFNNKVLLSFTKEIEKYENVKILRVDDASGKTDVPLKKRAADANHWGADIYLSFHHNANTGVWGTWTGTEIFVHPNSSARTHYIAHDIQRALVTAYKLNGRGVKDENFQVLRETNMPAILIEGGFMDSLIDIQKLGNKDVLKQAGKNAAQTVAQYGSLKRKQTVVDTNTILTVIAGDTLWGISRTYGVKVEDIRTWNNLKSDVIIIGQKLIVKKPVSIVTVSNSVTTAKNKRPAKKPTSTKVKYPLSTAILRNGSRGESVKQLQRALNKAKFKLKGKVDGIFDPATRKALNKVVN